MPEQNKNITLKSIYELMSNKFDAIDKRFYKLEYETNEKFKLIDNKLKIIENISIIKKELSKI